MKNSARPSSEPRLSAKKGSDPGLTPSVLAAGQDAGSAGFAGLGLSQDLLAAITGLGYEEPTPVQRETIPLLLAGTDLLAQAATGTGKTAAFALPMLQRIAEAGDAGRRQPSGLILVPTRELAMQVAEAVHKYARGTGLTVLPLYGGAPMPQQIRTLDRGASVVVATPGRALDHIRRGTLALDRLRLLVLDEADEMLDMGFAEDLDAILEATPAARQTALFSATMPARILAIANRHLKDPARVAIAREKPASGVPRVRQIAYLVARAHKAAALERVLETENAGSALVFCRTRLEVDTLVETLNAHGHSAEPLHGGMEQRQRDRVMTRFREGKTDLLVATDVAARGLDIERLSHVINYDVPNSAETYLHRIGRTGRAGREGTAITLVEPREHRLVRSMEAVTKQKIEIAPVPTVADLRARRLELTRASLREQLLAGDLEHTRVVVESLAAEFDIVDVAAAAVKLAHAAVAGDREDQEIPSATAAPSPAGRGGEARPLKPARGRLPRERGRVEPGDMVRLFVGAGRRGGIRPGDLVGAITGESGLDSRSIGAIEINDAFSLVEVPRDRADEVITALRGTKLRGQKVTVRHER
ncbi:MAG TPA: DEAD/DEAH box helicase [Vicinamibacterales bacterium]|nr:DEAD/DEAH box helicase [Vicinamibacterales bacterium]